MTETLTREEWERAVADRCRSTKGVVTVRERAELDLAVDALSVRFQGVVDRRTLKDVSGRDVGATAADRDVLKALKAYLEARRGS